MAGQGNVLMHFPVTSEDIDWGILSVAVPLDTGFLGQDTYFQWEALLSEALDYQYVLQSLPRAQPTATRARRAIGALVPT